MKKAELEIIKEGKTGHGILIENDGYMYVKNNQTIKESLEGGEWHVPYPFVVDCVLQKFGIKNANGRIYPEEVLKKQVELYQQKIDEKYMRAALKQAEKAAAIGVDTVNLYTGPEPWLPEPLKIGAVSMTDAWGMVFGAFDTLVPCAEKNGVKIAVENVWGMLAHDLYTNKFLIGHYDSDNLGVNLDPSHDALYGNTDPAFIVKSWGKKIFHVHVKDAVGVAEPGKFVFPLLGEGVVDFKAFFGALEEIGYDGCASVEFESWAYRANVLGGMHSAYAAPALEFLKKYI